LFSGLPAFPLSKFSIEEIYGVNNTYTTERSPWERYVLVVPKRNDLLRELQLKAWCILGLWVSVFAAVAERFQQLSMECESL
jgi:hypothetical protein